MYEKRRTHKNIKWFKQLKQSKKSGLRGRPIAPQGSTVAVLFTVFIAKVQGHHKYLPRKFLNLNITILMAPLIPSVVIPPGHLSGILSVPAEGTLSENFFPAGRGAFVNSSRSGKCRSLFSVFHSYVKISGEEANFLLSPTVGVLYEPPGPTVGLLKPFQKKMTNARGYGPA